VVTAIQIWWCGLAGSGSWARARAPGSWARLVGPDPLNMRHEGAAVTWSGGAACGGVCASHIASRRPTRLCDMRARQSHRVVPVPYATLGNTRVARLQSKVTSVRHEGAAVWGGVQRHVCARASFGGVYAPVAWRRGDQRAYATCRARHWFLGLA
jgi:hypothetical protein